MPGSVDWQSILLVLLLVLLTDRTPVASGLPANMLAAPTWRQLLDGKHNVDVSNHIVVLCEDGPLPVDHGVRGTALFTKVHDYNWHKAV